MFEYDPRISSTGKREIIGNIMNSFSTMYLTMISIVQGVALALLVTKVPDIIKWADIFTPIWTLDFIFTIISKIAYIVTTFLLILLTWHSYFWLAAIARWVPIIWDSVLFFVLGAFEFMLIESLSNLDSFAWFYLFIFVGVISAIQYKYNSNRLNDDKPKTKENNLKKINIWKKDAEALGTHVFTYKKSRAIGLFVASVIFLIIVLGLDLAICKSCIPISYSDKIKLFLILIVLGTQLVMIFRHKKDQIKSLNSL